MARTEIIGGAMVSICESDFNCPVCTCPHSEDDYYEKLRNSKHGIINKQCKGCKTPLSITTDIKGDVKVWEKANPAVNNFKPPNPMNQVIGSPATNTNLKTN